MTLTIIVIIIAMVVGIIALRGDNPKKKTREQYLQELTKFVEGTLEPIEGRENSFRVKFEFEDKPFVYEDFEDKGFKEEIYKAYIKSRTPTKLTLYFTEKGRTGTVRPDIFMASQIKEDTTQLNVRVNLPKKLAVFNVFTNNPMAANEFLGDPKVAGVFAEFKNDDIRGFPFSSLRVIDGELILEFHTSGSYVPSLNALRNYVPMIEDYLDKLLVVVKKLEEYQERV